VGGTPDREPGDDVSVDRRAVESPFVDDVERYERADDRRPPEGKAC